MFHFMSDQDNGQQINRNTTITHLNFMVDRLGLN